MTKRSFTVEFKSRRSQGKSGKPTSIWGNTDLKALARQVEEHSAHLFNAPKVGTMIVDTAPEAEVIPTFTLRADDLALASEPEQGVSDEGAIAAIEFNQTSIAAVESDGQDVEAEKKDLSPHREKRPTASLSKPNETPLPASGLGALEAENNRLKGLLYQKLQTENSVLKEMLARYR